MITTKAAPGPVVPFTRCPQLRLPLVGNAAPLHFPHPGSGGAFVPAGRGRGYAETETAERQDSQSPLTTQTFMECLEPSVRSPDAQGLQ